MRCQACAAHVDWRTCHLSWEGEPVCDRCAPVQPPPDVVLARRTVGGPLASRRGHEALTVHALGRPGAVGAAGAVLGVILLVSGTESARRGSLLVLSFGLLLMAASLVSVERSHRAQRRESRRRRAPSRGWE